jgi:Asp-tRNA(Asn)/Glu-tRNA(Gln) amidotransferase A subunit family amidase
MPQPPHPSRREFLAAGIAAAGASGLSAQPPSRPAAPSPDAPGKPGAVTADTIGEASKLSGIEFTEAERATMAKTIPRQTASFHTRQTIGYFPNGLAPALVFSPPLPAARTAPALIRSEASKTPALPASEEDIAYAPIAHLSRWIESKQLTSTRLTHLYLERLRRLDPKLKAVITLTEDLALRQARQADADLAAGSYKGPLHGIPWGAKDLFDTAGIRTTWGAEPYKDRVPTSDSAVVERLAAAGAVLAAKLSLGALAYGDIWFGGRTNNPWNTQRGSGGSSAGPAAATAAGMVAFGLGTETYGSIVSPSTACGVAGLRPTFGRISRRGAMALCWSLDKVGPLCRCVEDCALVLGALNGPDPADPSAVDVPFHFDAAAPVAGLKVGYDPRWFERRSEGDSKQAILDACRAVGLTMVEVDLPKWPYDSLLTILNCEAAAAFEELTRTNQDDQLSWQAPQAWPNMFRQSWFIPGVELVQAHRFRRRVADMLADKWAGLDAFIGGHTAGSLTLITNNTGHPSLTMRCGFTGEGVPAAVTLHGRLFDEGTLCRIGMALEEKFDVWKERPPLT